MNDKTLFAGALIYLLCLLGFLIPLKWLPRWGRLVGYVLFCIINIGLAFIYRELAFLSFFQHSIRRTGVEILYGII